MTEVIIDGIIYVPKVEPIKPSIELGIIEALDLKKIEDLTKLEYDNIYLPKVNAILTSYTDLNVVILPIDVIHYFNFKDNFVVGTETARVCPNWGGNTVSLNAAGSYCCNGGTSGLRASKCIYTHLTKEELRDQLTVLLLERRHRIFHGFDKFLGKGKTYPDPDCNCPVCNGEYGV